MKATSVIVSLLLAFSLPGCGKPVPPEKGFSGDDFEVGIGPASTTFLVSKPPYQDGSTWKMVVDGVELTRTAQ